jgi:hypothetical protein
MLSFGFGQWNQPWLCLGNAAMIGLRCFSRSRRIRSAPVNATDHRFFLINDDMLFQASFVCPLRELVIGWLLDRSTMNRALAIFLRIPFFTKAGLALIDRPA